MSFGGSGSLSDALINPIKNSVTKWPWDQEFVNPVVGLDAIQEAFMKKPAMPEVAPAASTPAVVDEAALREAAALEAERLRKKKGMKATILTSGSDAMMQPVQTQKAEALG